MLMSSTIASGRVSVALRSASAPSLAVETSNPESRRPRSRDASTSSSSSTTSTLGETAALSMPPSCLIEHPGWDRRGSAGALTFAAVALPMCHGHLNILRTAKQRHFFGASICEIMHPLSPRLIVEPDDGLGPVVEFIKSAEKSLLIKQFTFTEPNLIAAVIERKSAGVEVRVMLNAQRSGGDRANDETF